MKTAASYGGDLKKRFINNPLFRLLFLAFLPAFVASAQSVNVTVNGNAGPWAYAPGGLNTQFQYGVGDQASPQIVNSDSGLSFAPGSILTVAYMSGAVSTSGSECPGPNCYDADGFGVANNAQGGSGTYLPSFYINPTAYPVNFGELVGTFTDGNGAIVGTPQAIGDGPTNLTVPAGATQLQLGINDDTYSDNGGAFLVQVSQTSPELYLVPNPMSVSFSYVLAGTSPVPQPVTLSSSDGVTALDFTVTSNAQWLTAAPMTGNTPATLTIMCDPTDLPPNVYNGLITLTSASADNSPVLIPVTLTVTAEPNLVASPSSLTFSYQQSGSAPPPQIVSLASSDAATPLGFTLTSNASWLAATPLSGTTPGSLSVTVSPSGLPPATYTGSITVTAPGANNNPVVIVVSLTVGGEPNFLANPSGLTFSYQQGGTIPPAQTVGLTSSDPVTALSFTLTSNAAWLSAIPSTGTTPGSLSVTVSPSGLPPASYTGSITVTAPGANNSPVVIVVTLTVATAPNLLASSSGLTFSYQQGGPSPPAQTLGLASSDQVTPLSFTLTSNTTWLTATPLTGTTPGSLSVTVSPLTLPPATYTGSITITAPGANNSPVVVVITLTVTTEPNLLASPSGLTFSYQQGGPAPPSQTVGLTSSDKVTPLSFTLTSNASWLTAVPSSGTTPGSLSVTVSPLTLPPATYTGSITITAPGANNSPVVVVVTLTVATAPNLLASPGGLTFSYQQGGTSPPAQTVGLASSDQVTALSFTLNSNASWLTATSSTGTTPGSLSVTVSPSGLSPGTYTGSITLTATSANNNPVVIVVTLTVTTEPNLLASPSGLTFSYQQGGTIPPAQTVGLTSSDPVTALSFTLASNAAWLTATSLSGATPGSLSVSVNPSGLPPATYTGSIALTAPGANNNPVVIVVTLTVGVLPSSLSFTFDAGLPAPLPQTILIDPGTAGIPFTATTAGESWLSLDPQSGTTPASISVAVNATGLAPSNTPYMGTVTVSFDGNFPPETVPVTLFVPPPGTLLLPPLPLSFVPVPAAAVTTQTFTLASSNDGSVPFQISLDLQGLPASFSNPPLTVFPLTGATPALITVSVDPTILTPGRTYHPTLTFTSLDTPVTQTLSIMVAPALQPTFQVAPSFVQMQVQPGSRATSQVTLQNVNGSGNPSYTVAAIKFNPLLNGSAPWLSVAQPMGTLTGATALPLQITIDATNLAPGVYTASLQVTLEGLPAPVDIPVAITVPAPTLKMQLGSLGATFFVRQGQGTSLTAQIPVIDLSDQPFTVTASVDLLGQKYISVSKSAMSAAGVPGILTVSVQPDFATSPQTQPGFYYANVTISSPQVVNSPQTFVAIVQVQSVAAVPVQPTPVPTGLVFVSQAAGDPQAQPFQVFASTTTPVAFQAAPQTYTGPDIEAGTPAYWLYVLSTTGVASTAAPGNVQVAVRTAGLSPGIYTGGITVTMAGSVRVVHITLIVPPGTQSSVIQNTVIPPSQRGGAKTSTLPSCVRSTLVPTFVEGLPGSYDNEVGETDTITVQVNDNCGALVPDPTNPSDQPAMVQLNFTSGNPAQAPMMYFGSGGQYYYTWDPGAAGNNATVTVKASLNPAVTGVITGISQATGETDSGSGPVLSPNGVINNFDPATGAPLAPGTIVQIYGTNFLPPGSATVQNTTGTYNAPLAGVSVYIGGSLAYLYYVAPYGSPTQVLDGGSVIGAQIPTQLAGGIDYQIQVSLTDSTNNMTSYTVAYPISLVPSTPGAVYNGEIFAQNYPNTSLITAVSPATPGTYVVLYVDGLGATTPLIPTGTKASGAPIANTPVQVYLDGQPIPNGYAGLTPDLVGLYQVNFPIPGNTTPGPHSVSITQGNRTSGTGTLYVGSSAAPRPR